MVKSTILTADSAPTAGPADNKTQLLFSGADQPLLNIEAIRNPDATEDDVIAGVRVTGTADEP